MESSSFPSIVARLPPPCLPLLPSIDNRHLTLTSARRFKNTPAARPHCLRVHFSSPARSSGAIPVRISSPLPHETTCERWRDFRVATSPPRGEARIAPKALPDPHPPRPRHGAARRGRARRRWPSCCHRPRLAPRRPRALLSGVSPARRGGGPRRPPALTASQRRTPPSEGETRAELAAPAPCCQLCGKNQVFAPPVDGTPPPDHRLHPSDRGKEGSEGGVALRKAHAREKDKHLLLKGM